MSRVAAEDVVSFRRDIAPILADKCVSCHGPSKSSGGYRLDSFESLLSPGRKEEVPIVAEKPEESYLFELLVHENERKRMPKKAPALQVEQIELIRRWIAEGARFDGVSRRGNLTSLIVIKHHPRPPEPYPSPLPVTAVTFSLDGSAVIVGGYHELTVWDTRTGELKRRVGNIEQRVFSLRFHPKGRTLAIASGTPGRRGELTLLDFHTGEILQRLAIEPDVVHDASFDASGDRVAAACSSGTVRVFQTETGREITTMRAHSDWVLGVAWSPDGKLLATSSRDKTAKVLDLESSGVKTTYSGHQDVVHGIAFDPDGKVVWSSGRDGKVHRWNASTGKREAEYGGFGSEVYDIVLSEGRLLTTSTDGTAREHSSKDLKEVRVYRGHKDWVFTAAHHAASKRVATGSFDGEVRLWNGENGELLKAFLAVPPPREIRKF